MSFDTAGIVVSQLESAEANSEVRSDELPPIESKVWECTPLGANAHCTEKTFVTGPELKSRLLTRNEPE